MAAEALSSLGYDHEIAHWVERYKAAHAPIPAPPTIRPVDPSSTPSWREAVGDPVAHLRLGNGLPPRTHRCALANRIDPVGPSASSRLRGQSDPRAASGSALCAGSVHLGSTLAALRPHAR
jgi:hypothetical protein